MSFLDFFRHKPKPVQVSPEQHRLEMEYRDARSKYYGALIKADDAVKSLKSTDPLLDMLRRHLALLHEGHRK